MSQTSGCINLTPGAIVLALACATVDPGVARAQEPAPPDAAHAAHSGLLDGMAFHGATGAKGMGVHHHEWAIFKDGRFRSIACEDLGFEENAYRATREGDAVIFEAVNVSPKYGTMEWRGTVRDGRIEAHYVWTKQRWFMTLRQEYWFSGALREVGRE